MAIYGIDLGTTNSLLGLGDKLLTGLVPSIVDLKTKEVGADEKQNPNAVRSFKVDISMGLEGTLSVKASSEVLKELKRQGMPALDAYMDQVQKDYGRTITEYVNHWADKGGYHSSGGL